MSNPKEQFIADLYPAARRIGRETGMSWELILAQAALETGWGEKVFPGTNNIFNIKADASWQGESREFRVREFVNGRWVEQTDRFRVYPSIDDALRDRVEFLRDNPRYARAGLFEDGTRGDLRREAEALQRGGYATDPLYADKLVEVFGGRTMRNGIALGREQETEQSGAHIAPAISEPAHPNHEMFSDVRRRITEQTGHVPQLEAVANITLQMLENGFRNEHDIRGFSVRGTNVHVQGPVAGARVSVDLQAPTADLQSMSDHMTRQASAQQERLQRESGAVSPSLTS